MISTSWEVATGDYRRASLSHGRDAEVVVRWLAAATDHTLPPSGTLGALRRRHPIIKCYSEEKPLIVAYICGNTVSFLLTFII